MVGIGFLTLAAWALDWGWSRVQVLDGLGAIALLAVLIAGTLPLVLKWRGAGNIRARMFPAPRHFNTNGSVPAISTAKSAMAPKPSST